MDKYIINIYTSGDISWRIKVYLKKIGRVFTGKKNVSVPMGAVFNKRNRYEKNNIVYETYNGLEKEFSAFETLTDGQKLYWSIVIISLLILGLINIHFMLVLIVGSLTFIYFADFLFTLLIIARSFANKSEIKFTNDELVELDDFTLPRYTILCPLYKEWEVIEQFVRSIEIIDWPKDKLEVILLLEEDDTKTINKAYDLNLPSYFRIEVVPNSLPKTKPKACNYGLSKTTGEFVVVYDAEDKPDPLQLKKAYLAFSRLPENVSCLQSKLNYYNQNQNILTRLFTAEYSYWFNIALTGLQTLNTIIPLGGTSNHFRTPVLKDLQGWDPFNVTEDCDLGTRLFKKGYRTSVIDSETLEEANSNIKSWLKQRSRWIKGYMQTYLVHMRNPMEFLIRYKHHALLFQLIIGMRMVFIIINPILWLMTIAYFSMYPVFGPFIESLYPWYIFYPAVFCLIFANFTYLYSFMIASAKKDKWELIQYIFLMPFYWLLTSISAGIAFHQLITNPYYWEKTKHGLHLGKNESVDKVSGIPDITTTPVFQFPYFKYLKDFSGKFIVSIRLVINFKPRGIKISTISIRELLYTAKASLYINIISFIKLFGNVKISRPHNNKQNILILNWRDVGHVWKGGAEVYVQEIAERWVKGGYGVTILSGNDGNSMYDEKIHGVNIMRRGGFFTLYLWVLIYYVFRLRKHFDLIVDCENGIPFFSPLYSTLPKILLIHHVHQQIFRENLPLPFAWLAMFLESRVMKYVYRSTKIVTVSESSKADIAGLGLSKIEDIEIVTPGINLRNFRKLKKYTFPTYSYLGRLMPYKNIDILIKAFKEVLQSVPDAKLIIAGRGQYEEHLNRLVHKLDIERFVEFKGYVSENEKREILGRSWFLVQPSSFEGWGMTVTESNAAGTPVIASNTAGLRDSVLDGQTGILVKTKSVKELARSMIALTEMDGFRERISRNAYDWSRKYSWNVSARLFINILNRESVSPALVEEGSASSVAYLEE